MKNKIFSTTRILTVAFISSLLWVISLLATSAWGRYFSQDEGRDGAHVAAFVQKRKSEVQDELETLKSEIKELTDELKK